jgi:hypothetical protein
MKLHLLSLHQDWEDTLNRMPLKDDEYDPADSYFEGAVATVEHLLSVAEDIMEESERI